MATTSGFADLLDPRFKQIFWHDYQEYAEAEDWISILFNPMKVDEHDVRFSQVGAAGKLKRLDATGKVQYDELRQGYDVAFEFPEYAGGFYITRQMADDDKTGTLLEAYPRELALASYRTKQARAAVVFNNCTATTYTEDGFTVSIAGGDGVALCSDSHTFATGDTTAVDNYATSALSVSALDTIRQQMMNFRDDRGNLLYIRPDTIMVPPELQKTATEVVGSPMNPYEFSNTVNAEAGRWKVLVNHNLTDSNMWFMIDSRSMKRHLHWFTRVGLEFARDADDFDTLVARWRAYERYGCGFTDWRWLVASNPS